MSIDLESRIRAAAVTLGAPDTSVTARARATVVRARAAAAGGSEAPRRQRVRPSTWTRRRITVVAIAVLALGGAGAAVTATLIEANPPGSVMRVANPDARARIDADPILSKAPWVLQQADRPRVQEVETLPSLVFPPGVDYASAVQQLYTSVAATGELPAGTRLGAPLEAGRVVALPASPGDGLALDLRAPFGYALPGGQVLPPTYSLPGSLAPDDVQSRLREADRRGLAIPDGAIVDPTQLRPCMVVEPGGPPPCALSDHG